jgi:hypothetical protein
MSKPQARPQKLKRPSMFRNGRTVSFKMEEQMILAAMKSAYNRQVPFSMWMREAAEDKLARETTGSSRK